MNQPVFNQLFLFFHLSITIMNAFTNRASGCFRSWLMLLLQVLNTFLKRCSAVFSATRLLVLVAVLLSSQGCTQDAMRSLATFQMTPEKCPPVAPKLTPEMLVELRRNAKDVGPLWRIEKDGRVSWLYGTVHVSTLERRIPGPNVMKAISEADILGVETLEPENVMQSQTAGPINHHAQMPVAPDQRDILVSQLLERHFCLPAGTLEKAPAATPTAIGFVLSQHASQKDGVFEAFGLDNVLRVIATEMKKPIRGLERPEDRNKFLEYAGLTPATQQNVHVTPNESNEKKPDVVHTGLKGLKDVVISLEKETKTFHLGFKIWGGVGGSYAALDLAELDAYLVRYRSAGLRLQSDWASINSDDCKGLPFYLCGRNPQTAAELEHIKQNLSREIPMANEIALQHSTGQRVFVAVGAFHVRPEGLPALMRAKGFTVDFVKHSR